jgi:hypothetical protein
MQRFGLFMLVLLIIAMPTAPAFAQDPGQDSGTLGCDPVNFVNHLFYFASSMESLEDVTLFMGITLNTVAECWDDWLMMLFFPTESPSPLIPPESDEDIFELF